MSDHSPFSDYVRELRGNIERGDATEHLLKSPELDHFITDFPGKGANEVDRVLFTVEGASSSPVTREQDSRLIIKVGAVSVVTTPEGAEVYVGYADAPEGVTPIVAGNLSPGSHTILLRREGMPPMAPRYVPETADMIHGMLVHLRVDPSSAADSNGDGIPDWLWEQHGYDPANPPNANAIADASDTKPAVSYMSFDQQRLDVYSIFCSCNQVCPC